MADEPSRAHEGGRLQDGSEMTEEELRAHGLWRWPQGGSPSAARPEDPVWERARKEGIGPTRPEDERG